MPENESHSDVSQSSEFKNVNRVLAGLAVLAAGWTLYGTSCNVTRFVGLYEAFARAKVSLPGLALLAVEHQAAFVLIVLVIAATCAVATVNIPERRSTVYLNVAGITVPLVWWVIQTTAFYITSADILKATLGGRGPVW
jgi:hypothetical protein